MKDATWIIIMIGLLAIFAAIQGLFFWLVYRKAPPGHALIVNTMKAAPKVTFTGCTVIPVIHSAHLIDLRSRFLAIAGVEVLVDFDQSVEQVLNLNQKIGGYEREQADRVIAGLIAAGAEDELQQCGIRVHRPQADAIGPSASTPGA